MKGRRRRINSSHQHQRQIGAVVSKLLKWYSANARDLPWRHTNNPYSVLVSEIMLQQTQVQTVIPYYERWMQALPTVRSLARARPGKIHKLWEGLGYYTRVRNLQRAAKEIVQHHGGIVPSDLDTLLALPGIGRYTAGAICSIAFNQPMPVADGNVIRVLARVFGIRGNARETAVREKFWKIARRLVRHAANTKAASACSHFNQALMELGAVVCTTRQTRCDLCPVNVLCVARQRDWVAELPTPARRLPVTKRRFLAFVLTKRGKLFVRQRPDGVVNGHLWEFPNAEAGFGRIRPEIVAHKLFGVPVVVRGSLGAIKHSITRYRITLEGYRAAVDVKLPREAGIWVDPKKLRHLPFSSAHKKLLQRALP